MFFLSLLRFILSSWELLYVISVRGKTWYFYFPSLLAFKIASSLLITHL